MIVKDEFLSRLRKIFGLNLYEVKVWTALLSRGVSTAGELSDISSVPRSRTYDILESLEKKGFVVLKLGKPIKFVALKPTEVVERVKRNVMRNAQSTSKRLDELKESDVLSELGNLYTNGIKYIEPTDLSGAIRGRHNIYNHLDMMIRNASKNVTIVTSADGLNRKFESLKTAMEKAKKKGVKIQIAAPITPKNYKVAKDLSKVAEIKNGKFKARFAFMDNKEMMFMILDDEEVHPNYDVGIWINSPFFTNALGQIFQTSWATMKPLSKIKIR
ncbi:MAG: TrmB family transcriptional regulator [Candidatus Pacearchaeota archaeon]|nr:MAG: TrmB family transcriptional regulator [Candidatus Pacearchaeota archaeon]